jgi:hypothetical protein
MSKLLVDPACKKEGFNIEYGRDDVELNGNYVIEESEKEVKYYKEHFYEKSKKKRETFTKF